MHVDPSERKAYYRVALAALRFAEHRLPTDRRFGANADARWNGFRGSLATADRIDLLIRDADTQWPGSLGARSVFALPSVAEDDAFGSDWSPLDPVPAEELWREATKNDPPASPSDTIAACTKSWNLTVADFESPTIAPADRLVVSGPSAIAAAIVAFEGRDDLDWTEQVVCVATPPAHRQLAALGTLLLNATKRGELVTASEVDAQRLAGRKSLVSQDDANPDDARLAQGTG